MEHVIVGLVIFLYCLLKHKDLIKTDYLTVAKFCGFMMFVTALRWGLMDLSNAPLSPSPVSFWHFLLVFTEDMAYAMPIYFALDYLKVGKWVGRLVIVAFSLHFAMGHLAYGLPWAMITLLYPYFISYKYGKKHGFGTVMVCHILYDFMTLAGVYLYHLTKLMMLG